ncbi:sigma intracellular receptor 2 [Lethenteron reissneri]|uniref:sigma intracellular receptor 2 n=1 Tax=Lethenteron reissneri TaxID=7753 RepID=UPI002AB7544B|nr:sigma intracellular receptor 2 [Lethenteron reissneri]
MAALRALEWIFVFYFASHVPITLLFDSQALLPKGAIPSLLSDPMKWYIQKFKDPLMANPPAWFFTFIYCEIFLQLPFFPIAAYAFYKGGRRWIRIPALVYASHVATSLLPILSHVLLQDFTVPPGTKGVVGPSNVHERLSLAAVYLPYLLVPLLIIATMCLSSTYAGPPAPVALSAKQKKK